MARLLEFNEAEALTAAMFAFRRLGYHGVSIKTLEAETGLSSGSLYNSFGGKDAIFERALNHYNETVVKERIQMHLGASDPITGLISLFQSVLDESEDGAFGCLLTNTAIEFAGQDNNASQGVRLGFGLLLTAFEAALMRLPNVSSRAAASASLRLLTYYQGLLVLVRHGHDKTTLHKTIITEINAITGELNA